MTSKIYVPSNGPLDWKPLLADGEKQWKDGYSAKCAAERWEGSNGLPSEIERQFDAVGLAPAELLLAIPELKTPLPGGWRESQTDVFALVRASQGVFACCVEAKVAETFGPTVDEWMVGASKGKVERLTYLAGLLGLPYPPPGKLRYQLFHRCGAALIEATRFGATGAAVIVHSFSPAHAWLSDFQAFANALGAEIGKDKPALISAANRMPLLLGWATGYPSGVGLG